MQTPVQNRISQVRVGAALAFVGVALGAFGTHTLQEQFHITPHYLDVYRTGIQYHLIHALALIVVGLLGERQPQNTRLRLCGNLFALGIVIFGGSLYTLALTSLSPTGPLRILGAITPLGGVCFLTAWAMLAFTYRPALNLVKENPNSVSE